MEFCPECGATLLPNDGKLECKCGYTKDLLNEDQYTVSEVIAAEETVKMVGENSIPPSKIDISIYKPRRFNKIEK